MNCHDFISSPQVSISCSFDINISYASPVPCILKGTFNLSPITTQANSRESACGHYTPKAPDYLPLGPRRKGAFCNRFWIYNINFVADYTSQQNGQIFVGEVGYPRPWDSEDPYYSRATAMWDNGKIALETSPSIIYSTDLNFYIGGFYGEGNSLSGNGKFKDGETFDVWANYPVGGIVGSASLSISK